ncbi:psychosine receptor-like [Thalassophryne amazonica]|uniref:psychosine receptor-like n=1 Tax=Thalassophryne amazonica TaxID=390379 RepID=UPI0014717A80|nr:psychosine receptor-like [Thalassophryne amazonica]
MFPLTTGSCFGYPDVLFMKKLKQQKCVHPNSTSAMENLSLAANHSECFAADSAGRQRSFLFFYLGIIITSIPSNAFALYVSWKHIRQKNELGVYLFNLALSDLTFTMGLSLWMEFLWRGIWVHGGFVCLLSIYILFTNFYTSDALLCCIAFDRYLAVVHPFKFTSLRKVSTAAAVSVTIWMLVICFNAATITWEDAYYENDKVVSCFDMLLPLSEKSARANIVRFLLGFLGPVLLMIYSTWRIRKAVTSNQATDDEERKRNAKLLGVALLCVVLCFGPVHIIMFLRTFLEDCRAITSLLYPYKISIAMSNFNCLVDPLLYCFITRAGKAKVNQVVLYCQRKKRSNDQSAE